MFSSAALLLAVSLPPEASAYAEAGYDFGADLPKSPTPTCSAADFGTKPNEKQDDGDAFEKALEKGGVIAIPAGEYTLPRRLYVRKPGTIILGATKTRLRFTKSLEELEPSPTKNTGGKDTTLWSWIGGLLTFQGTSRNGSAHALATPAKRRDTQVTLRDASTFKAGPKVVRTMQGKGDDKLVRLAYAGDPGKASKSKPPARIASAEGTTVTLKAPLLLDLPEELSPTIADAGARDDYGLRVDGFLLVTSAYRGYFKEDGWNPLEFSDVRHGRIDDLLFSGVDSGPFISGSPVTVRRVLPEVGRPVGPGDLGLDAGAWNALWNLKGRKGIGAPSTESCPAQATSDGVDMKPPCGSLVKAKLLKVGEPVDLWLAVRAKPTAR